MAQQTAKKKAPQDHKQPNRARKAPDTSDYQPVVIDTTETPEAETIPLFVIDGREYHIQKELPPSVAMAFLKDMAQTSTEVAMARMYRRVIGEEGMDALIDCPQINQDQMTQILDQVEVMLYGAMDRTGMGK